MRLKASYIIATVCGAGRLPFAPGTWGSLAALPLCILLSGNHIAYITAFAGLFFLGVLVSGIVEKEEQINDPGFIVIDEFACLFAAFLFLPLTKPVLITGFILYRILDIVKPPPCRQLEKAGSGWGVMLDDLAAGIYTNIILRIVINFL